MTGNRAIVAFGMTEADILVMLDLMRNWARWVDSDDGPSRGECASIEHRYVAPRPDEDSVARSARQPLGIFDAENVETALSAMRSPVDRQFLIHRHLYSGAAFDSHEVVRQHAAAALCRRFGLQFAELERCHLRCLSELRANLSEVERIRATKGVRVIYTEVFRFRQKGA